MSNKYWATIKIHHPTDDLKDDTIVPINSITKIQSIQWMSGLNEIGSFNFSLRLLDAQIAGDVDANGLKLNNIVKIYFGEDNTEENLRFVGVIEDIDYPTSTSDNLDPIINITGRGIGSIYEDMLLLSDTSAATLDSTNANAGEIFTLIYADAITRGCPDIVEHTFTDTLDSAGNAYANIVPSLSINTGVTLSDVIRQLQEIIVDVTYSKGVEFWNEKGTDKSDAVNINKLLTDVSYKISGKVKNAIYVKQNDIYTQVNNAPSIAEFGRKETLADATNIDPTTLGNALIEKLKTPNDEFTIAYKLDADAPTKPYIDYDLGDLITITLPALAGDNQQIKTYVRAITVSGDNNGEFIITPELGSQAQRLESRLEKLINKLNVASADGYSSEFNSNYGSTQPPNVTSVNQGSVVTYNKVAGTGTVDVPTLGLTNTIFTNATQTTLKGGDTVAVAKVAGSATTVVIALYPRDPGVPQEDIPVGSLDVNFPIYGDGLPNPIRLGNQDYWLFNDPDGVLGLGSDLIGGESNGTTAGGNINAISRQTGISYSIATSPASTDANTFLMDTGDLIKFKSNTFTKRDKVTGIWTDWSETSTATIDYAYDPRFNHLFMYAVGATGGPFFFINSSTGTPTALGDAGTTLSNSSKDNLCKFVIKDGVILLQKDDGTNYYLYSSAGGLNFVRSGSGIGSNVINTRVVASEYYDLLSITTSSNIIQVNTHNSTTGVTTTLSTGIDVSNTGGDPKNVLTSWQRYAGVDYFLCLTLGSEIDPTLTATRYYLSVYAHSGGTTTRIYTDGTNYGVNCTNGFIIGKVTNSLRFVGYYDTVGTYLYSITLT